MNTIPIKKSNYLINLYIEYCPAFGNILKILEKEISEKRLAPNEIEYNFEKACKDLHSDVIFPFKNVKNEYGYFDNSICLSVNDVVAHGNYKEIEKFNDGDLISIDCGFAIPIKSKIEMRFLYFDAAFTTIYNKKKYKKKEEYKVLTSNLSALTKINNKEIDSTYEISKIIEETAIETGHGIVTNLTGHGIGLSLHEAPRIYNAKHKLSSIKLFNGLVLCIEPIYTTGNGFTKIYLDEDGWTTRTIDKSKASHFESMFLYYDNKLIDLIGISDWF